MSESGQKVSQPHSARGATFSRTDALVGGARRQKLRLPADGRPALLASV